ncbi:hypothetical protein BDK51DRAFT_52412, partial [Blyttiomyces helicus]
FLEAGGLTPALKALSADPDSEVRSKALHCISSSIRDNAAGFAAFVSQNGFSTLASAIRDGDSVLLRRATFLYRSLLEEDNADVNRAAAAAADGDGVADMAAEMIVAADSDVDLVEKCLQLLISLARVQPSALSAPLRSRLSDSILPSLEHRTDDQVDPALLVAIKAAL